MVSRGFGTASGCRGTIYRTAPSHRILRERRNTRGALRSCELRIKCVTDYLVKPSTISTTQLRALLHFHLWPIKRVVCPRSYLVNPVGGLILKAASCLDAFSTYPFQTWLLGNALGRTTDTPEVCPPRSSRTRGSSPQASCAHSG